MLERVHPARIATGEWIMCGKSKDIYGWVSLYLRIGGTCADALYARRSGYFKWFLSLA